MHPDPIQKIVNSRNENKAENLLPDFIQSLSIQPTSTVLNSMNKFLIKATISQFSAEIIDVVEENKEFKTLSLKRPNNWSFIPGQYVEIRAENSTKTQPAILAIASSINDEYIKITAKPSHHPHHAHYCLNCVVGHYLTITGPLGTNFPIDLVTMDTPVLILGGGSSLTTLKSIIESLPKTTDVKMIYSNKTSQTLLYQEEIEKWKSQGHIISLTQDKTAGYAEGRINKHIKNDAFKPNTLVFICGPQELVLEITKLLVKLGISREFIYGSLPATAKEGGPVYRADHPRMMLNETIQTI